MFKAIRIANELEDKKGQYAESQNKLAELTHQYREYRNNMERNERRNERIVEEFREKAASLEEENRKVCTKIGLIHKMQNSVKGTIAR